MAKILDTAASWQRFKGCYMENDQWNLMFNEANPLETLADMLLSGTAGIGPFDFQRQFHRHMRNCLPGWQAKYENDKKIWDDFLNGPFGVLNQLARLAYGVSPSLQVKYLRQLSQNGSAEAFDELSDSSYSKGDYKKALKYQLKRQANHPKIGTDSYWDKKRMADIETSVVDLMKKPKITSPLA